MDQKILDAINAKLKSDFKLVKQFDSGIANINYLLKSDKDEKIVARILGDQKPENIDIEFKLQKALIERGINTPLFLQEGNLPILIKCDQNFVTLTKYIESDSTKDLHLSTTNDFLKEIGCTLAKVQLALKDFPYQEVPPNYLHPDYQNAYIFNPEDLNASIKIKNVIDELYLALQKLRLPKTLIHGDLNDGNYLSKGNKIIAVLDLETTEFNYRILDISGAIYYTQPSSGLSYPGVTKAIIEGFQEVTKLSAEEINSIPIAVQYNAACFSLWSLANEKGQASLDDIQKKDNEDEYDFLKDFYELQNRIKNGFKA